MNICSYEQMNELNNMLPDRSQGMDRVRSTRFEVRREKCTNTFDLEFEIRNLEFYYSGSGTFTFTFTDVYPKP
jgi:hypothetical protein